MSDWNYWPAVHHTVCSSSLIVHVVSDLSKWPNCYWCPVCKVHVHPDDTYVTRVLRP